MLHIPTELFHVAKPSGPSSTAVVQFIRKVLTHQLDRTETEKLGRRRKLRVGHGGTLDPLAAGVLVVGVGRPATRKLSELLNNVDKVYRAEVRLGAATPTLDVTADREQWTFAAHDHIRSAADVEAVLPDFRGRIMQTPPKFSALRTADGKRAYKVARKDPAAVVALEPRPVHIHRLECTAFDAARGTLELEVTCGSGTYVRALVDDIGRAMGTLAVLQGLTRTRQGPFRLDDAVPLSLFDDGVHHLPRGSVWQREH